MFEQNRDAVDELLDNNDGFRRLYDKHCRLNAQVDEANAGDAAMEQLELETLKKEKLLVADQLQAMLQAHLTAH
ncbi:MAG: YdcH family protein [Gammaproteobacteria bacterium]